MRPARLSWWAVAAACLLLVSCGRTEPTLPEDEPDLPSAVRQFVDLQHGDGEDYRTPSRAARDDLAAALLAEGDGRRARAQELASRHGYVVVDGPGGSRLLRPAQLPDPRGWGALVVLPGDRELVVEAPHPRSDLDTDVLAAQIAQAAGARYLVVAGARRVLADGAADPSRRSDTLLHAVHVALAARGVAAAQVHGYADESLPGSDVVVSTGSGPVGDLARAVAEQVERSGLRTCRAWRERCGQLEGRKNVQGLASQDAGAPFVHLELARRLRADAQRLREAARAIAGGLETAGAG